VLVRKTVTALFCDIDESVALGERVDPEVLRTVLARYFEEMSAVLERHGGTVEKYIGDAIVAIFGIPKAHEDDALRAVRAAVEMRARLAQLNAELARDREVTLELQIGIDTGEVVVGGDGTGTLATGEAMNVAARLQQAAGPGEILIGKSTYALVKDAVEAGPLEMFTVKGKRAEVGRRRVHDVAPEALGVARRLDASLIGRQEELRLLVETFDRAEEGRQVELVTVLGVAGIGKSRLAQELVNSVSDRAVSFSGRCLAYGEGITLWPLRQIVPNALRLAERTGALNDDQDASLIRERLAELAAPAAALGNEETFWAVRKLFEAIARRTPLVVMFEDIHWAEPRFIDLIEYLAGWTRDVPLMLLCLARPDLIEKHPNWTARRDRSTLVVVEPLSGADAEALIDDLAQDLGLGEEERQRIAEAAEGNPLFLEQMVARTADDPGNGALDVPPTIQALLAERLDRLSGTARQVLERAAVIGKQFAPRAVIDLSPDSQRADVTRLLMELVRRDFIQPDVSPSAEEDGFRFRHGLIRDAAYAGTAREERVDLHGRLAQWIEESRRDRLPELEEIVGYHYEQAYRNLTQLGWADERAQTFAASGGARLASAGRRALARGDGPASSSLLERAISLLEVADERKARPLLPELGAALNLAGRLVEADSVLTAAIERAHTNDDPQLEAASEIELAVVRIYAEGETAQLAGVVARAIPIFEEHGDERGLARTHYLASLTSFLRCEFGAMEQTLRTAIRHARAAGDRREERQSFARLAVALALGPTPVEEAIVACRRIYDDNASDRTVQAMVGGSLAELEAMCGRFDEARALYTESKEVLTDLGNVVQAAGIALYAGPVELLAGEPEVAERELRGAYELLSGIGERSALSTVAAFLARALLALDRLDESARFARDTQRTASPDDVLAQTIWRATLARVEGLRGSHESALELAQGADALARTTDSPGLRAAVALDLARVLTGAGQSGSAEPLLREALELYIEKGNVVGTERTRDEIGLYEALDPGAAKE
jgi:class 3 adenylate cyclase/tetratricopeptide (TPR) repeat protein